MKAMMLEDLEALVEESAHFAGESVADLSELLRWGARREAIFARLKSAKFELPRDEEPTAVRLIQQLMEWDRAFIAKLEKELAGLEQQISAARKMRQLLKTSADPGAPILLRRVA